MTSQKPILLVTRPEPSATQLVEALRKKTSAEFQVVISPLLKIEPLALPKISVSEGANLIFTSVHAVEAAKRLPWATGRKAWCVGNATAEAAKKAGFKAVSSSGNSDDLIKMILRAKIPNPLMYLRGDITTGDVAGELRNYDLNSSEVVVYRQLPMALNDEARQALAGNAQVIAPLFSPNTARVLANQLDKSARISIVAMSNKVAESVARIRPDALIVANQPSQAAMIAAICTCLGGKTRHCPP